MSAPIPTMSTATTGAAQQQLLSQQQQLQQQQSLSLSAILPQPTLRLLADKFYDKRKQAALEVERLVRECVILSAGTSSTDPAPPPPSTHASTAVDPHSHTSSTSTHPAVVDATRGSPRPPHPLISALIRHLTQDFCYSPQANSRNGGLIAMAAIAIALGPSEILIYLDAIMPPVLACLQDQDARVRYYACETMYNICKVARHHSLAFFNELFDSLSKLAADTELSVKNGADLLDRLIKDIVAEEEPANAGSDTPPQSHFSLSRFIPLLAERIYTVNPFTRSFLVSWITVLDCVPNLELITHLPDFLDGLLGFVSDSNDDVRVGVLNILAEFLREIREIATIDNSENQPPAEEEIGVGTARQDLKSHLELGSKTTSHAVTISWTRLMQILLPHTRPLVPAQTQATALSWLCEFILLAQTQIIHFVPDMISAVLPSLASSDAAIRRIAERCDTCLRKLVSDWSVGNDESGGFEYAATVGALTLQFSDVHEKTRVASLEWLLMLHKKAPEKVITPESGTFPALLKTLSDGSDQVVKRDLQLLSQISSHSSPAHFKSFISSILSLFSTDSRLLEARGSLIIRQLCIELGGERIFCAFADALETEEDLEFANLMVVNLNWILMTANEVADVRRRLRALDNRENHFLFVGLYRSWCHNAIATFSLCLLAQAYDHSSTLLQTFTELEMTVPFLIQADKLVQLLESPVFTYLRLQLLEPERYPALYKSLFGILMLLPQSSAFATLRNRLSSVGGLSLFQFMHMRGSAPTSSQSARKSTVAAAGDIAGEIKFNELLAHFLSVQGRHEKARGHAAMRMMMDSSQGPANNRWRLTKDSPTPADSATPTDSTGKGSSHSLSGRKGKSSSKTPNRSTSKAPSTSAVSSDTVAKGNSSSGGGSRYSRLGLTLRNNKILSTVVGSPAALAAPASTEPAENRPQTVAEKVQVAVDSQLVDTVPASTRSTFVSSAPTVDTRIGDEMHSFPHPVAGKPASPSLGRALITALGQSAAAASITASSGVIPAVIPTGSVAATTTIGDFSDQASATTMTVVTSSVDGAGRTRMSAQSDGT